MVPCLQRQPVGRQVAQGGHTDGHAPTTGRVGAFYICNVSDRFISRFQKVQLWRGITKCSSEEGGGKTRREQAQSKQRGVTILNS